MAKQKLFGTKKQAKKIISNIPNYPKQAEEFTKLKGGPLDGIKIRT